MSLRPGNRDTRRCTTRTTGAGRAGQHGHTGQHCASTAPRPHGPSTWREQSGRAGSQRHPAETGASSTQGGGRALDTPGRVAANPCDTQHCPSPTRLPASPLLLLGLPGRRAGPGRASPAPGAPLHSSRKQPAGVRRCSLVLKQGVNSVCCSQLGTHKMLPVAHQRPLLPGSRGNTELSMQGGKEAERNQRGRLESGQRV